MQAVNSDLLFQQYIREGDFLFKVQRKQCFVFILRFIFHLGKNPSFEACLFKLIRKTINEGSFHEMVVGGISVMGESDQSSNTSSTEREVSTGCLFSWKS